MSLYNHRLVYRPLLGGVEIFNERVDEVGTLGFVARSSRSDPARWIVSCYHVLVGPPTRSPGPGEAVLQPSDGTVIAAVDEGRADADLDCAAAKVAGGVDAVGSILGIGSPADPADPAVGMRLIKSGASTGVTEGVIVGIAGDDVTIATACGFDPNYDLSQPGDSGSLWVERATLRAVALHVRGLSGGAKRCSAKGIVPVLEALNLEIVNGP
jgi:endonuclease G